MDSFKRFSEEKLPNKKYFYSSVKDGALVIMVKNEDYLNAKKFGMDLT